MGLLRPRARSVEPQFLCRAYLGPHFQGVIRGKTVSGTVNRIPIAEMGSWPINLPSVSEQHRLNGFFHTLDALIAANQRKCDLLKRLKQGYLQKLFPAPGETVPRLRFLGFNDTWEQRKLGDLATLRRGLTYKPSDVRDEGIRVLRSSNINEDTFVLREDDVFVRSGAVNIDLVGDGDILITSANGSSRLVGKHAIVDKLPGQAAHGGFMLLASAERPEFVNALMSAPWYESFINSNIAGGNGAIGNLSKTDLEEQKVAAPSSTEQTCIGDFFHFIDRLITLHQQKCDQLQDLKRAYLQKMFV